MKSRVLWYSLLLAIVVFACREAFEYSPNQVFDNNSQRDINAKNLVWLDSLPKDDTVIVALVGDSQRFYDELEVFIDTVNQMPMIDFVLLAGDISDFGLLEEFELIQSFFFELNKPYIGVIGNHDLVARGNEVFERMYGPLNFSFVYDKIRFVIHDTNGVSYETKTVPDMDWLRQQMMPAPDVSYYVGVSHMPPYSEDFNRETEIPYRELLRETPNFLISLHGHVHALTDGYPYNDNIRYLTAASFDKRNFVVLKFYKGIVETHIVNY